MIELGMRHLRKKLLVFCISFLIVNLFSIPNALSASDNNFCLDGRVIKHIMIDVTSASDDRAKSQLQVGFAKIAEALKNGEKIVISTIEDSYTANRILYEGCVPHCENSGLIDSCTEGSLILEKRRQMTAISKAIASSFTANADLPNSDIFRTLYFATKGHQRKSELLTLIVFSDMIENSEFVTGKQFFSSSAESILNRLKKHDVIPNFKSSRIIAFGIGRGGTTGRVPLEPNLLAKVRTFWKAYFQATGAIDIEISESYVD